MQKKKKKKGRSNGFHAYGQDASYGFGLLGRVVSSVSLPVTWTWGMTYTNLPYVSTKH